MRPTAFAALSAILMLLSCRPVRQASTDTVHTSPVKEPADYFFMHRATPGETFSHRTYVQAFEDARALWQEKSGFPGFDQSWVTRGPANIGARINTVAVHPDDPNIMYAGFSAGGLFKTTDGGANWFPIFDDQPFLAIGHIHLQPGQPNTVFVGTGDPNISGFPFLGNGVYKSTDAGQTWTHLGLSAQCIISKVLTHPNNPDIIYAAAMGLPFQRNNDRGLYKTVNGGQDWQKVFGISDQAGIIDLVMHPNDPNTLYAAGWDRIRNNQESVISGNAAKVFKTTDGGANWAALGGGLPDFPASRIGLAISQSQPNIVYAQFVGEDLRLLNLYRSTDNGATWATTINTSNPPVMDALASFGWYFGKIRVNPSDPNDIFMLGIDLWRSWDGGITWYTFGPPWWTYDFHADKHDLIFRPDGRHLVATDGGLYRISDIGDEVDKIEDIPATQFYRVAYNPHQPNWYFGGAQDNGTTGGADLGQEWPRIYGGDGFQSVFHPLLPNVFYAETQNGGIVVTLNGGANWRSATEGIIPADRRNWDMPYFLSSHNPDVLYTGTYRVYKSTAGNVPLWEPVSDDLTDGIILHPRHHTITAMHESPVTEGLVYVGTTDGNLWRTDNGGANWTSISTGLPKRYITDVKASPQFPNRVYVTHSGYRDNDFTPRIFRSDDRGATWQSVAGNLPNLAINHTCIIPGHQDTLLFVGTDGGVYGTLSGGGTWARLGNNMPMIPIYDLDYNPQRNELVAGSHARSILSFPLDSVGVLPSNPVSVAGPPTVVTNPLRIFPVPARHKLTVAFPHHSRSPYQIVLLDMEGRLLQSWTGDERGDVQRNLELNKLPAGVYVLNVKSGAGVLSGKVVKE